MNPFKSIRQYFARKRGAKLEHAKEMLRSVPEGAALLDMAAQNGTEISFSYAVLFHGAHGVYGIDDDKKQVVLLNPLLGEKKMALVLAHELRHMWQTAQLDEADRDKEFDFRDTVAFTRFVEGDAFAFEAYIAARIESATGQKMPRTVLGEEKNIRKSIEHLETPEGISKAAHQLRSLFNAFQWGPFAEAYDHLVLGEFLAEEDDDRLSDAFNAVAKLSSVKGLEKIATIDTGKSVISYLYPDETENLAYTMWGHIRDEEIREAARFFSPATPAAGPG